MMKILSKHTDVCAYVRILLRSENIFQVSFQLKNPIGPFKKKFKKKNELRIELAGIYVANELVEVLFKTI